jgi:preprotein translocase subunit SecB
MSDENAGQSQPPNLDGTDAAGAPMMLVNAQYVKDLSFENPNAPASLSQQTSEPNVQIAIDVNADQIADKSFEVSLTLRAEGTSGTDPLFIVEIVYAGVFTLGEVPDEYVPPMLYIEAPRQLFPFARAIIADAVRDGGFPPLLVQPIDFMSMYQQRVAQVQADAGEGEGDAPAADGDANGGGDAGDGSNGEDKQKFEFEL